MTNSNQSHWTSVPSYTSGWDTMESLGPLNRVLGSCANSPGDYPSLASLLLLTSEPHKASVVVGNGTAAFELAPLPEA